MSERTISRNGPPEAEKMLRDQIVAEAGAGMESLNPESFRVDRHMDGSITVSAETVRVPRQDWERATGPKIGVYPNVRAKGTPLDCDHVDMRDDGTCPCGATFDLPEDL